METNSSTLLELLERADLRDKPPSINAHATDHVDHVDQSLAKELRSTTVPSALDDEESIDTLWFLETEDTLKAFLPAYPIGKLIYVYFESGYWASIVIPQWLYRYLKMGTTGHSEEIGNIAPSNALFILTLGSAPVVDYVLPRDIQSRVRNNPPTTHPYRTQSHLLAYDQADEYNQTYATNPASHIGQFVLYQPAGFSTRRWHTVRAIDKTDPANPVIVLNNGENRLPISRDQWKHLRWLGSSPTQAADGVWSPYWDVAFDAQVAYLIYKIKWSIDEIAKTDLTKARLNHQIMDFRRDGLTSRKLLRPHSTNPLERALKQLYSMDREKDSLITERDGFIKDLIDLDPAAVPKNAQHLIHQAIQLRFRLKAVDDSIGEALNLN